MDMRDVLRTVPVLLLGALAIPNGFAGERNKERVEWFETHVRPVLVDRCVRCHGPDRQSGGLRLDSAAHAVKGGDSGKAIVPNNVKASLLAAAILQTGELKMPPDKPLSPIQQQAILRWIETGAVWPNSQPLADDRRASINEWTKTHWAFQPVRPITAFSEETASGHPIDALVNRRREKAGLKGAPEASRATTIRRLHYTLTGLPPTYGEVQQFVADPRPTDVVVGEKVDSLLSRPQYGEHWARHWLDVARYSDTKGYVYGREERFWVHAWSYRDWVVRSLNDDMPYDRFLTLQLAADQVEGRREQDWAALGFLTIGRRFLGVERDIIDDRIDVVTRGAMGLTVACARCHDHKFDAIPTADYYSLFGVFASSAEGRKPLPTNQDDAAFQQELKKRTSALNEQMQKRRAETAARIRARIEDYLVAQTELEKYPPKGFDQIFETDDMLPAFVRRWESHLNRAKQQADPVFVLWHAMRELTSDGAASRFAERARDALDSNQLAAASHPLVLARLQSASAAGKLTSFRDVIACYAELLREADRRWTLLLSENATAQPRGLPNPEWEVLRQLLYGEQSPCVVPNESITNVESYFRTSDCTELWKLQGSVDKWIIQGGAAGPHAVTLHDRQTPTTPRIFVRGNPQRLGETVPRRFLTLLSAKDATFSKGSGRHELARAIVDPDNPLTARVMVNRVWMHHFGTGLVSSSSDFGLRAEPPSHPQLLDYLARRLIEDDWSLKSLHRLILTSATFRQASTGPTDAEARQQAMLADPTNRMLWRYSPQRLTFEQFRDALFSASGELDSTLGGKPVALFNAPYSKRRTLYGLVDRQFLPSPLRVFDFASPDLHVPQRSETTVPQQALFLLNHPLVLERARRLAARTQPQSQDETKESRVKKMFRHAFQREPVAVELNESVNWIREAEDAARAGANRPLKTAADWSYGFGQMGETGITNFRAIPHFTGDAWQGGSAWPDAKLGWVQLTADGGHPGNDRAHACVRRWTAPSDMTVAMSSRFQHQPSQGDGVRVFVAAAGRVLLKEKMHQASKTLELSEVSLKKGESIDFVVDIDQVLNSDQFLWDIEIKTIGGEGNWHSNRDFTVGTVNRLSPWEQLAHVLLCSNEFLFVD